MWGMLRQLAPAIRDGWVRVHMIDLKGGTETEIGKSLFHRRAITVEKALELLPAMPEKRCRATPNGVSSTRKSTPRRGESGVAA